MSEHRDRAVIEAEIMDVHRRQHSGAFADPALALQMAALNAELRAQGIEVQER